MRYYRKIKPTVRTITVKYPGKCACCGGVINAGQVADYYPVGTIAGVHVAQIAHLKAMQGDSIACSQELKKRLDSPDSFDLRYEDDCKERCGL